MSGAAVACIPAFRPPMLRTVPTQLIADVGWRAHMVRRPDASSEQPMRELHLRAPSSPLPVALPGPDDTLRPAVALGRVLLVEDDRDCAALLCAHLRDVVEIRWVDSAEAALRALVLHPIDLVLSDVMLPGRSGVALCRSVRGIARLAQVPVLLMSAVALRDGRSEAALAGASDYFVKPVDIDLLRRAIVLALPRRVRESIAGQRAAPRDTLLDHAFAALPEAEFGVREWAERAHLSERQLRRRVLASTGLAPLSWLREQRLLCVRRLLDDGVCGSLHEAGARVGLVNRAYLSRLYRARFAEGVLEA